MRMIWAMLVAAMLAATGCGNATAADFTLRYADPQDASETLTVEVAGDGRVRVEDGRGQWMIVRDGQTYFQVETPNQQRIVVRLEDYMAVGAEVRAAMIRNGALDGSAVEQRYEVRPRGARTVGQWRGTGYEVAPVDPPGELMRIAISDDPAFADIRERAVAAIQAFERPAHAVLIYAASYDRLIAETLARGMPISYNGTDLREMNRSPIAPARFELPSQPLTREQLRATMRR